MKKFNFKSILICFVILPCLIFMSACGKKHNYAKIEAVSVNIEGNYKSAKMGSCLNYFKAQQANYNFATGIRFSIIQESVKVTNDKTTKLKEVVDGIISVQGENVYGIAEGKYDLIDGDSEKISYANLYRVNNTAYKDDGNKKRRGDESLFVELPISYNPDEIYTYLFSKNDISKYYDYTINEHKFIHKIKIELSTNTTKQTHYYIFENNVLTAIYIKSTHGYSNNYVTYTYNCIGFSGEIYLPNFDEYK